MARRVIPVFVIAILAVLVWTPLPAQAAAGGQSNGPALDVRVGFDGYVQSNAWAPVNVTASNNGPDVSGELRVVVEGFAGGRTIYSYPIDLPRGSRKQVTLYVAGLSSFGNTLDVELVRRGRVITAERERVQFVPATTLLIGLWTDAPQGLASLSLVVPSSGESKVAVLTEDDLPPVGQGWAALDVLVISDVDSGQLSPDQQTALREWVAGGGRLIVTGGPGFARTLAGLGDLTPVAANDTETVSLTPLSAASGAPFDQQAQVEALVATGEVADGAQVMIESDGVPLWAARDVGYGRVDFLAAAPSLEPLRSWPRGDRLWTLILAGGRERPGWAYGFIEPWDTARQAAAAVPGVRLPSVIQLCGFLFVYAALVGPINYFVLWRLKRRELAWITIPLLVLVFSAMAYVTGFQLRGSAVIVHRLGVIQTWAGSDRAKVDALVGVWSPRRARYDVELGPGYLGRPMPRDLGGGLAAVGEMVVEESETVRLRGVQVDVGSVNPLVIEGYTDSAPRIEAHLDYRIDKEGLVVSGDLINRSDLDLTNVTLMVAGTSQRLPDFPAGEVLRVNTATTSDRALPGGGTGFDPFPATHPYSSYYYPGSYGPLAAEITGVPDCWSTPDRQRQCNLVTSILNADWRGSGAYLFGWTERVPVDMRVLNANARMEDMALVIVELAGLPVASVGEAAEVPPGLMTWRLIDSSPTGYGYISSPYDFYLPAGEFLVVRFEPLPLVRVPEVARLVIHLETYYAASTTPPIVAIHNFATRRWDTIAVGWGNTTLQDAGVYVDASGGVELRIQPTYNSETSYSRFDVTLVGTDQR